MKNDHPVLPYLLLTLAVCTWGGNIVLGRAMHGDIPPLALTFFRWSGAFVVLLPLCLGKFREDLAIVRGNWKWLLLLSASGVAIFHSFVYTGLNSTTAINAGLMMATGPIIIPVIAYLIHRDRLTRLQALGIVASVVGVCVIITRGDATALGAMAFNPGDLWILAAVPMWGYYSVILKDRPSGLSSRAMMLAITGTGSLMLAPFYLWEFWRLGPIETNPANLLTVAYISVIASVVAYFAWNKGVADVGAIKAGQFLHVTPVFAALLAMVFLGETLEPFHIPGIAFIAVGLALTTWKPRKPRVAIS